MLDHAASSTFQPPPGHPEAFPSQTDLVAALSSLAVISSCSRGQEIRQCAARPQSWHRVVSGAVRCGVVRLDGRRQITDFLLRGDFFSTFQSKQTFLFEAIADGTVVASYPRRTVEQLADKDAALGRQVHEITLDAEARLRLQILVLGRSTAEEKVGSFLLSIAERLARDKSGSIDLPMTRYDIADYLNLSVETVSRSLTSLRRRGAIRLPATRSVRIVNRALLDENAEVF